MKKTQFTEEQVLGVLKQVEGGRKIADVCREQGISDATYHRWKAKYGVSWPLGSSTSVMRRAGRHGAGHRGPGSRQYAHAVPLGAFLPLARRGQPDAALDGAGAD